MTETTVAARRSITVNATPERAFDVFTAGFSTWWPLESHHIGETMATEAIIEPFAGGRWFERDADGNECNWGFVTEFEPPSRVLLAWHLNPEWGYDPDPEKATEVEITFTPVDGRARSSSSSTAASRSTARPAPRCATPSPRPAAGPTCWRCTRRRSRSPQHHSTASGNARRAGRPENWRAMLATAAMRPPSAPEEQPLIGRRPRHEQSVPVR